MPLEDVVERLLDFGLTQKEAKVYVVLAKMGPKRASEVAQIAELSRVDAYRTLGRLQKRWLVETTLEKPIRFIAVSFEESLNLLIHEVKSKIQRMEENKAKLLRELAAIPFEPLESPLAKFRIIQGRSQIYKFRLKMFESAKKEICTMTTKSGLLRSINAGTDDVLKKCAERGIRVRRVTEMDQTNVEAAKRFMKFCEVRHIPPPNIARLTIIDENEIMIYTTFDDSVSLTSKQDIGMWTDNREFVCAMKKLYDEVWSNAVDAKRKIAEIEAEKWLMKKA